MLMTYKSRRSLSLYCSVSSALIISNENANTTWLLGVLSAFIFDTNE